MNRAAVITGLGLVTPLGSGVDETWRALMDRRYITTHARCPLDPTSPDRVHHLATAAAAEAVADANWRGGAASQGSRPVLGPNLPARGRAGSLDAIGEGTTALVVGTSKGAVETWLTAPPERSFLASVALAVRARFPLLDGPSLTLSAACASGLHALIRAAMMIRFGEADRVLVVTAEASVHPLFLGSFQRLGVLPREGVGCRPFDEDRGGFLMSEAAAAVCLEAAESRPGADIPDLAPPRTDLRSEISDLRSPYARLDRYALGGDATHMTGSDPNAAVLRRLLRAVVDDRRVDLIHAHGTGTIYNDPIELAAFEAECVPGTADGHDRPTIFSHKGALGHSLGAAGLVGVALSCLMHRKQIVPPNVQTRRPLATRRVALGPKVVERRVTRSIAIGSGFGGSIGVVSLCCP